jgi:hypothetical protein
VGEGEHRAAGEGALPDVLGVALGVLLLDEDSGGVEVIKTVVEEYQSAIRVDDLVVAVASAPFVDVHSPATG